MSNLYPPHYIGGYEIGCQEAVEGLRGRGYEVFVLTSDYGLGSPTEEDGVYRWLDCELSWPQLPRFHYLPRLAAKERRNQKAFLEAVRRIGPDLVYAWNLASISISIAFLAQRLNIPVAYFAFDEWLASWDMDPWYAAWNRPRHPLAKAVQSAARRVIAAGNHIPSGQLDLSGAQFASEFLKQSALHRQRLVHSAPVIHWGVATDRFCFRERSGPPCRLLYVGQVVPHKGLHTLVGALAHLLRSSRPPAVTLTIVGGTHTPSYYAEVQNRVRSSGLAEQVRFYQKIPRTALPDVYDAHDVLVFPSIWNEPFGLTQIEAMAAGMPVIGTATGGSAEILSHGVNGLVFSPGDEIECAEQVARLVADPALCRDLSANARAAVVERFDIQKTMTRIAEDISRQIGGSPSS